MVDIKLNQAVSTPLYKQIAEQVRQLVASERLKPGDQLPTVRQLAQSLKVNPNTVVRAYLELEQERIAVSRHGGGTIISASADDPVMLARRQRHLSGIVSSNILEVLSLGYRPEELEAAFHLHLARWREERRGSTESPEHRGKRATSPNTILIVGSHDMALNLLVSQTMRDNPQLNIEVTYAGSLGGLIALQEERADMAGIHLLDEETGEYNYPYIKRIMPGREIAIVHLAYRIQGLMFAPENPKQIKGLRDLRRPEITFVNRQKGSGTRVLLDLQLRQSGVLISDITGYERELDTHLAVGSTIAKGEADVGLGIEAAARSCGLGFLPLFNERYDLVIPKENYQSRLFSPLLEMITSEDFKKVVDQVGGYDTTQTGMTTFL